MKKTFLLTAEGKDDARVRDKIRHEINKYVKRERKKDVPEGFFRWDFNCRLGPDDLSAKELSLSEIPSAIDTIATEGVPKVYVEILAVAVKRSPKPATD